MWSPGGRAPPSAGAVTIGVLTLRGELLAQERHQLVVGELCAETGRLAVASAALGASDGRHVDGVVTGPQRDLAGPTVARGAQPIAHEGRQAGPLDGAEVVDNPFGVALLGIGVREVADGEVGDRQAAVVV